MKMKSVVEGYDPEYKIKSTIEKKYNKQTPFNLVTGACFVSTGAVVYFE